MSHRLSHLPLAIEDTGFVVRLDARSIALEFHRLSHYFLEAQVVWFFSVCLFDPSILMDSATECH